ncbi:MAG: hypothetical protein E6I62_04065 [Chloroflexi bacterium]|nr:MAG: hypothetical protein E6I62_04065 [Chloroflexota bacterium]
MLKSFVRTLRGPTRDPRMAHISRPLPRNLLDEQVLEAIDLALAENPEPAYLVETLPAALRKVTGHDYEVLDRTTSDVTGSFVKASVMIRDGAVGLWPGYAARAYPLLARDARTEQARAAIAAGAPGGEGEARKPGWEPPPPVIKRRPTGTRAPAEVGQDAAQASE